jgi:RNA-directed DNA polymerase
VNEKKTRRATLPEDAFTFLGYTFCRQYSRRTGVAYLGPRPAIKKIRALCRGISELTDRRTCLREVSEQVAYLNRKIGGWANVKDFIRSAPPARAHSCAAAGWRSTADKIQLD